MFASFKSIHWEMIRKQLECLQSVNSHLQSKHGVNATVGFLLYYLFILISAAQSVGIHLTILLKNTAGWDKTACPKSFTILFCHPTKKSKQKRKQTFNLGCNHTGLLMVTYTVWNHVSEHFKCTLCFLSIHFSISFSLILKRGRTWHSEH